MGDHRAMDVAQALRLWRLVLEGSSRGNDFILWLYSRKKGEE